MCVCVCVGRSKLLFIKIIEKKNKTRLVWCKTKTKTKTTLFCRYTICCCCHGIIIITRFFDNDDDEDRMTSCLYSYMHVLLLLLLLCIFSDYDPNKSIYLSHIHILLMLDTYKMWWCIIITPFNSTNTNTLIMQSWLNWLFWVNQIFSSHSLTRSFMMMIPWFIFLFRFVSFRFFF